MADVDFSNAVLRPLENTLPMANAAYMALYRTGALYNLSQQKISQNESINIITDTPTKTSIAYSGEFTASGTEFYIVFSSTVLRWKVSNVSFSAGDTYSFIVEIETSGNA